MAEARLSQARLAPDDDLPLLDRVLEGDTRAFDQLVERHESRVYRVAMAITGNHQDAEEAMQDAFLKAHRHLREFQRASKFSTWLTRIAVNEALQICRRRRTTESLDDPTWTDEGRCRNRSRDWHDDPEKIYSKQQIQDIVARAIQSLPPLFRKALVLRDIESLSAEEAADALGIGVPALKSRALACATHDEGGARRALPTASNPEIEGVRSSVEDSSRVGGPRWASLREEGRHGSKAQLQRGTG